MPLEEDALGATKVTEQTEVAVDQVNEPSE